MGARPGPELPLLVTRAADEAEALAATLGPHAIPAPCLVFEPVASPPPDLRDADLLVASPRALPGLRAAGVDPTWRVLALAPSTTAALVAAGVRVDRSVPGGGAELAAAARPDRPVIAATSDLGGAEVRRVRPDAHLWVLYRTSCPDALPPRALAALSGPFDVLFASPSAVRHFERLAPGALARARRVLCHGETTFAELRAHGIAGERWDLPRRS